MLISVIIPTLHEEAHIGKLIDYLKTCPGAEHFEILVSDGGSSDHTIPEAEKRGVRVIACHVRCRATQMNLAAHHAKGDVLYFVHADTIPPSHFVDDIHKAVLSGHAIGGYRFRFNPNSGLLRFNSFMTRFNVTMFRGGDQTIFITSRAWKELRGYDEKFVVMEEYDLLKRATQQGYRYHLMPAEALVSNRKYQENSWLRVNFANVVAMTLFRLHASPVQIKKIYSSLLRNSVIGYKT